MIFSVCTVAYGDYPELLQRTLTSLTRSATGQHVRDLRIGLNAVSDATRQLVMDFCGKELLDIPCYVFESSTNVGKYPLMRRMFYDAQRPLADYIMWFDDDSYLSEAVTPAWWDHVTSVAGRASVLGAVHSIGQRGNQYLGIREQPWYRQKHVGSRHSFRFVTGGWWVADSNFIGQYSYPFVEVHHNGGDSILGELVRQCDGHLVRFDRAKCHCESCLSKNLPCPPDCVHVNVGGRKGRRGLGRTGEVYPWQYHNVRPATTDHHLFDLNVYSFAKGN